MNSTSVIQKVERSLKRFLKRKVACTASLLTAFLITGSLALANATELDILLAESRDVLLASLQEMKKALESAIKENDKTLRALTHTHSELIREASWYSKVGRPSIFVGGSFWYTKDDSKSGTYKTPSGAKTPVDEKRAAFRNAQSAAAAVKAGGAATPAAASYKSPAVSGQVSDYHSSGWILGSGGWDSFTTDYDRQPDVAIKPAISITPINPPEAVTVTIGDTKQPEAIEFEAPSAVESISVNISPVSLSLGTPSAVTTPHVTADVSVQEPTV